MREIGGRGGGAVTDGSRLVNGHRDKLRRRDASIWRQSTQVDCAVIGLAARGIDAAQGRRGQGRSEGTGVVAGGQPVRGQDSGRSSANVRGKLKCPIFKTFFI